MGVDRSGSISEVRGVVELEPDDLPAFCPNPKMPLWSAHPRVYLDVAHAEKAQCPYCSTVYRLKPGSVVHGH
ncbi:MAG: zinc-finger domain-containing protein [Burkholderiaceae bacterium]|nr:zinc-finger domain-containing protein [Burkholderiaceae bacterium]